MPDIEILIREKIAVAPEGSRLVCGNGDYTVTFDFDEEWAGYNNCFSDTQYTTIPADAEYITLYFGINDDHQNVPIGTETDATNTTFCGAWNEVLAHLIANHPLAHIGIIVSNGTSAEYAEATKTMAKRWGIPYLDLTTDEQAPLLIRTLKGDVCADAVTIRNNNFYVGETASGSFNYHPNADCHEYMSRFIESWFMRL